jgi:excisionase family DNA binding protein
VCAEHLAQMSDSVLRGPLLTVAQVADQLSVSEKTVRRLVAREELPAVRVGHAIRVDRAQLTHWVFNDVPSPTTPDAGGPERSGAKVEPPAPSGDA